MELEHRYLTIKLSDLKLAETKTPGITEYVGNLLRIIEDVRMRAGKPKLEGLVIENDWPEYEPTLKLLSDRVDAEACPIKLTDPVTFTNTGNIVYYDKCNGMTARDFGRPGDHMHPILREVVTFIGGFAETYVWTDHALSLSPAKQKALADLIWIRKTKCKQ